MGIQQSLVNMSEPATIDSIPNEILRQIVDLVVSGEEDLTTKLKTMDEIGKVSTRFRGVASAFDPFFWRRLKIRMRSKIEVVENRLHVMRPELAERLAPLPDAGAEGTRELEVNGSGFNQPILTWSLDSKDLLSLAATFRNLKKLRLKDMRVLSWPPRLPEPWTSVEELHLVISTDSHDVFAGVDLSLSFPSLTAFHLEHSSQVNCPALLPDLTGCKRLKSVTVTSSSPWGLTWGMSVPSILEEKVPLPRGLKKLQLCGGFVKYDNQERLDLNEQVIHLIRKHLEDCEITRNHRRL